MIWRRKPAPPPAMTLEGVLGPNSRLDAADGIVLPGAVALCPVADGVLVASRQGAIWQLRRWEDGLRVWSETGFAIAALCAGPDGRVVAVSPEGRLRIFDAAGRVLDGPASCGATRVLDAAVLPDGTLAVADAGAGPEGEVLTLATWEAQPRGRVLAIGSAGAPETLAEGLHWPTGLCPGADGLLVAQCARATVSTLAGRVLRDGLPGYLGRLRRMPGGYLLSCLARRDPLIDFLATQDAFVDEMRRTIPPALWIAPRTSPAFSADLPIEMGATRLFGAVKPWAPSFSYGLVIELDDDLLPVASAQSRADGSRHAIADACLWQGDILALSRASDEILRLPRSAR